MGRVFNLIVRMIAIPRFQDTQCGFKSFRREVAREVFTVGTMDGWAFDVEALFIALHRGYKVLAVPIDWYHDPDSRVSAVRDTLRMVRDVLEDPDQWLAGRLPAKGRGRAASLSFEVAAWAEVRGAGALIG